MKKMTKMLFSSFVAGILLFFSFSAHAVQPTPASPYVRNGVFSISITDTVSKAVLFSQQGTFHLVDSGVSLQVDLLAPFGVTLAKFSSVPGRMQLQSSAGVNVVVNNNDMTALLQQYTNVPVPVDILRHWIRGENKFGAPLNLGGQNVVTAKYKGWMATLDSFDDLGPTHGQVEYQQGNRALHVIFSVSGK